MANVQYYGTGRRKHSVARVRLVAGEGNIIVNGRAVEEYFNYETLIRDVKQPLVLTNNENIIKPRHGIIVIPVLV